MAKQQQIAQEEDRRKDMILKERRLRMIENSKAIRSRSKIGKANRDEGTQIESMQNHPHRNRHPHPQANQHPAPLAPESTGSSSRHQFKQHKYVQRLWGGHGASQMLMCI